MAIKASASITLSFMVDVKAVYRYYKLQASTASEPSIPTTNPPSGWTDTEPRYISGSTNTLYFVDLTVFSNDTWIYSSVSKSSSYEASKEAYNKALNVETALNESIGNQVRLTNKGFTSPNDIYYKLATLPIDDDFNYSSIMINGRIGGWINANMGKIDLIVTNRASAHTGENIFSACQMSGNVTAMANYVDFVIYKQDDLSAILYMKLHSYWAYDITMQCYQSTNSYSPTPVTPVGTLIWTLSESNIVKVDSTGAVIASLFKGKLEGNANTATKLATSKNVKLTGSVTGSGTFDGSGDLNITTSTNHTHGYAGSTSAGGSANSAVKLDSSAGSATQPVYFKDGKPVATTYTLGKSVPSNAQFTDTTYSNFVKSGSGAKSGLVPAPSTTAGKTKYLREDCTWAEIPTTSVPSANASTAGITKLYSSLGTATDGTVTQKVINDNIEALKKSVSDGKTLVAKAITDKGTATASDATFQTMADNISQIETGIDTSDATASASDILYGKTAYVNDKKLTGTMTNRGAITQSLSVNGSYTIPAGYHNGSGKVTQNITTKAAATYSPSTKAQTIAAGQYLSGAQTIAATTGTAAVANVLKGKTFNSANGIGLTGTMTDYSSNVQTVTPSASQTGTTTFNIADGYHTQIKVNCANVYKAGYNKGKAAYKIINWEWDGLDWTTSNSINVGTGYSKVYVQINRIWTSDGSGPNSISYSYNSSTGVLTVTTSRNVYAVKENYTGLYATIICLS